MRYCNSIVTTVSFLQSSAIRRGRSDLQENVLDKLRVVLDRVLGDTVTYRRWEKVLRKNQLIARQDSKANFIDLFLQSLCDLAWHDFLTRMQQSAIWNLTLYGRILNAS
ncbi:Protein SprT [Frankliniella fusca]|uniref:Protein SprT n=1 Tax=Frankliniella fusca TaxID=407009 RepID=A0AAE1H7U8_9NEOP|nr:Protein SprT [Frankliniella fusca]